MLILKLWSLVTVLCLSVAVGEEDEVSIKEASDEVIQAMGFEGEVQVSFKSQVHPKLFNLKLLFLH